MPSGAFIRADLKLDGIGTAALKNPGGIDAWRGISFFRKFCLRGLPMLILL